MAPQAPLIVITMGDPAGIGPEVLARHLHEADLAGMHLLLIGSPWALQEGHAAAGVDWTNALPVFASFQDISPADQSHGVVGILDIGAPRPQNFRPGAVQAQCGLHAVRAVECAAKLCLAGKLAAMVTCPIHKEALHAAGFVQDIGHQEILAMLAEATNIIAQGEVMQFSDIGNLKIDEARYMEVIRCKTALLFQASAQTGAALAGASDEQVEALKSFGREFGLAYQLIDDWLDYAGSAAAMGKNAGDDLAEGKLTLPLIYALAHGAPQEAEVVRDSLITRSADRLAEVLKVVGDCGALDDTRAAAMRHSEQAKACVGGLPANAYRDALAGLIEFAQARLG